MTKALASSPLQLQENVIVIVIVIVNKSIMFRTNENDTDKGRENPGGRRDYFGSLFLDVISVKPVPI